MSEQQPSWDLYGALLAVLRAGSLSGAARALGVAQPTIRRQIEQLEGALKDTPAAKLLSSLFGGTLVNQIVEIARLTHEAGAYFYCDGANFIAIVGRVLPWLA
jgi:hypothetical protein